MQDCDLGNDCPYHGGQRSPQLHPRLPASVFPYIVQLRLQRITHLLSRTHKSWSRTRCCLKCSYGNHTVIFKHLNLISEHLKVFEMVRNQSSWSETCAGKCSGVIRRWWSKTWQTRDSWWHRSIYLHGYPVFESKLGFDHIWDPGLLSGTSQIKNSGHTQIISESDEFLLDCFLLAVQSEVPSWLTVQTMIVLAHDDRWRDWWQLHADFPPDFNQKIPYKLQSAGEVCCMDWAKDLTIRVDRCSVNTKVQSWSGPVVCTTASVCAALCSRSAHPPWSWISSLINVYHKVLYVHYNTLWEAGSIRHYRQLKDDFCFSTKQQSSCVCREV